MTVPGANQDVFNFYEDIPFNFYEKASQQVQHIKEENPLAYYPDLVALLDKPCYVLEAGCGTGCLSLSLAHYYHCQVVGIDFNASSIKRAREVAQLMPRDVSFVQADLFSYEPEKPFDLILSMGALHHTNDCHKGFLHLVERCLKPGGCIYVGLYHLYGRQPFLNYFDDLKKQGCDEKVLFEKYKELHRDWDCGTRAYSWFRDQVLHPHETQHTLKEFCELFDQADLELLSTSINHFQHFTDQDVLFEMEKEEFKRGQDALREKKYYPGFFTLLARRRKC